VGIKGIHRLQGEEFSNTLYLPNVFLKIKASNFKEI
jgi:hypothetical protein